jgi:hypothetical protein
LVLGHGGAVFFEGRDWQRCRELEGSARGGFQEDLVGNTAMFVLVSSAAADILLLLDPNLQTWWRKHTDLFA